MQESRTGNSIADYDENDFYENVEECFYCEECGCEINKGYNDSKTDGLCDYCNMTEQERIEVIRKLQEKSIKRNKEMEVRNG